MYNTLNYQVAKIYQFALQESTTIFTVKGSTMDRFVQVPYMVTGIMLYQMDKKSLKKLLYCNTK